MNASEMTNEELAACIASARLAPAKYVRKDDLNFHREAILEAAARLRRQDITIAAQKAKGAAEGYSHGCEETREKSSQVGNAAKLREACEALMSEIGGYSTDGLEVIWCSISGKTIKKARAALSAPPRNCDVGTAEEQYKRFLKFCHGANCSKCPVHDAVNCKFAWAQMPYDEGGVNEGE